MAKEYPIETNKFMRVWIRLWYNDAFRIICLMGIPVLPVFIILLVNEFPSHIVKGITIIAYCILLGLLYLFNDYSNLRRIGRNEYGEKIKGKSK